MKRILDPEFRYTPSFETDIRRTFERIRRERSTPNGLHNRLDAVPGVARDVDGNGVVRWLKRRKLAVEK